MELWIRSQDKKNLSKANNIKLDRYLGDNKNVIISNEYFEIGKYKSEERAIEVLDEIQHRLIALCDSMNRHLYVYEMPED